MYYTTRLLMHYISWFEFARCLYTKGSQNMLVFAFPHHNYYYNDCQYYYQDTTNTSTNSNPCMKNFNKNSDQMPSTEYMQMVKGRLWRHTQHTQRKYESVACPR